MQLTALLFAIAAALSMPGEVAFIDAARGDGGAVCIVDTDGGEIRQVGPGGQDGAPRWSPDGEWLAFETATPGGRGLHVVRADGSDGRKVGAGPWCTTPAWSTDGARLIYSSAPARGTPGQLHVIDLNSGEDTIWGNGVPGIVQPVWLPFTGLMLALDPEQTIEVPGVNMVTLRREARMGEADLKAETLPDAFLGLRLSPDSSADRPTVRTDLVLVSRSVVLPLLNIADPERAVRAATLWSVTPNWRKYRFRTGDPETRSFGAFPLDEPGETTRVAFESNEGGDREIMILGKRGIANVSNHRAADWNPVWSPDGDNLAFESFRGGTRGIHNVYADTAHVSVIAAAPDANCWSPAWSPDGGNVGFVSDRDGQPELYRVEVGEGKWTPMTTSGGPKAAPAWRPVRE